LAEPLARVVIAIGNAFRSGRIPNRAKLAGLTIRLFGLASVLMAAISSSRSFKVEDSQTFDDTVGIGSSRQGEDLFPPPILTNLYDCIV